MALQDVVDPGTEGERPGLVVLVGVALPVVDGDVRAVLVPQQLLQPVDDLDVQRGLLVVGAVDGSGRAGVVGRPGVAADQ